MCEKICGNCLHWRDKAWTDKGWGICDNQKNEVKVAAKAVLYKFIPESEEWALNEVLNSIRYPEDFGCKFFEKII